MDPCAGRNGSGMIRTPRVRAPDPHRLVPRGVLVELPLLLGIV